MLCMVMQKEQKSIDQKCKNCGYVSDVIINPSVFRSSSPTNNVEIPKTKDKYEYRFADRFTDSQGVSFVEIISGFVQFVLLGFSFVTFINSEYLLSVKGLFSIVFTRVFVFLFVRKITRVKVE